MGEQSGFWDEDVLAQGLKKDVIGPAWGAGVHGRDVFQQEVSVAGMDGASQDGVQEAFITLVASGAGGWLILVKPGSVSD